MKFLSIQFCFVFVALTIMGCKSTKFLQPQTAFPQPVDTSTKEIQEQEKKIYKVGGLTVDNQFDGARLNDFTQVDDTTFRATIEPENFPINASAYFGMRMSADTIRDIHLELFYTKHRHRYVPKLSYDRKHWWPMHHNDFDTIKGPNIATLRLQVGPEQLYICGQELTTSSDVKKWSTRLAEDAHVEFSVVGKSKKGRDLYHLDICKGSKQDKDAIIIISRQHPPEVPGHMAMEAFVEEILKDTPLSNGFRDKFRILVYPLLNPDGVDMGHWRHSAGGIDLNRDWSLYRQDEIKALTNHMVQTTEQFDNDVLVGLDFHSTQKDLYYTLSEDLQSSVFPFKDHWMQGLDQHYHDYTPDDRPSTLNTPISKGWFYLQFEAEGITYEIGDETPRNFVRSKGATAANELMKLLVLRTTDDD